MDKFQTNFQVLKNSQKKNIILKLEEVYDVKLNNLLDYTFYLNHKGKIFIFNGSLDNLDLSRINNCGIYFGTFHDDDRFRLSLEGTKFLNPKKNYVILKTETLKNYLAAEDLFEEDLEETNYDETYPFLIVKLGENKLGCVSKKENSYLNYIPKSRKLDFGKVF